MRKFDTKVQHLKYKVLRALSKFPASTALLKKPKVFWMLS